MKVLTVTFDQFNMSLPNKSIQFKKKKKKKKIIYIYIHTDPKLLNSIAYLLKKVFVIFSIHTVFHICKLVYK